MIQDGKLRGFAMSQAIPVRTNYTAGEVRTAMKDCCLVQAPRGR